MKKSFKTFFGKLSRKKDKKSLMSINRLDNFVTNEEPSTSSDIKVATNSLTRKFHSFNGIENKSVTLDRNSSLNELKIVFDSFKSETVNTYSYKKSSTISKPGFNQLTFEIQTQESVSNESSTGIDQNQNLYQDLFDFIHNFSSHDSQFLYKILNSIRTESICTLSEMNGFRKDLLIFASLFYYFSNHSICTIEQLLSQFWEINDKRLQEGKFLRLIELNSQDLMKLEKNISEILKVRTKNNLTCIECGENSVSVLYLPCGHIVICSHCHGKLQLNRCKVCSCIIDEAHNVYF